MLFLILYYFRSLLAEPPITIGIMAVSAVVLVLAAVALVFFLVRKKVSRPIPRLPLHPAHSEDTLHPAHSEEVLMEPLSLAAIARATSKED